MYESFYGLQTKPFSLLPDPEFLYLSNKHKLALAMLEYALMNNAGFCVISGEIGAGKTTLLRRLLASIEDNITVGMITNTHQSFGELLDWVLSAFGIHQSGLSKVEMHQRLVDFLLEQYANNKTTLLIVDEAQNMPAATLEELRMLSNINSEKDLVLQVILAGQPDLKDTLKKPELKQFAQRISVDFHLSALSSVETSAYIQHRLVAAGATDDIFTPDACRLIHHYSGGVPRLINLLCDTVLVYGFADQRKMIDADLVEEMVRERMENSILPLADTGKAEIPAGNDDDFPWINPEGGTRGLKPAAEKKTVKKTVAETAQAPASGVDGNQAPTRVAKDNKDAKTSISAPADNKPATNKPSAGQATQTENIKPSADLPPEEQPVPVLDDVVHSADGDSEDRIESGADMPNMGSGNRHPGRAVLVALLGLVLLLSIPIGSFDKEPVLPDEVQSTLAEMEKIKQELARARQQAETLQHERDAAVMQARQNEEQRAQEIQAALEAAKRKEEAAAAAQRAIEKAMKASRQAEELVKKQRLEEARLREERKLLEQERKQAELVQQRLLEQQRVESEGTNAETLAQQQAAADQQKQKAAEVAEDSDSSN
jgi:type II secretory pathway predicted ATPase ExeA